MEQEKKIYAICKYRNFTAKVEKELKDEFIGTIIYFDESLTIYTLGETINFFKKDFVFLDENEYKELEERRNAMKRRKLFEENKIKMVAKKKGQHLFINIEGDFAESDEVFEGRVFECDMNAKDVFKYERGFYSKTWITKDFIFGQSANELIKVEKEEIKRLSTAPKHYDNSKGSIYKFASDQNLNSYEFDIIKRIIRSRKKGNFREDLEKTKFLIDLYLTEYENI
jgi:hypothetical protein